MCHWPVRVNQEQINRDPGDPVIPCFNNSLFEDFCEFGLGMALGNKKMKERVAKLLQEMIDGNASDEYKALAKEWIDNKDDADKTKEIAPKLREAIRAAAAGCPVNQELQTLDHYLVKRSQWIIGGDGGYPPRDTR